MLDANNGTTDRELENAGLRDLAGLTGRGPGFDALLDPIAGGLIGARLNRCGTAARDPFACSANRMLPVEGGREALPFKITHKDTAAPHVPDTLSSHDMPGPHVRSVLPRISTVSLPVEDNPDRSIRGHANLRYGVVAANRCPLLQDQFAWETRCPLSARRIEIEFARLGPVSDMSRAIRSTDVALTRPQTLQVLRILPSIKPSKRALKAMPARSRPAKAGFADSMKRLKKSWPEGLIVGAFDQSETKFFPGLTRFLKAPSCSTPACSLLHFRRPGASRQGIIVTYTDRANEE